MTHSFKVGERVETTSSLFKGTVVAMSGGDRVMVRWDVGARTTVEAINLRRA